MTGRFAAGSGLMSVEQALAELDSRIVPATGTEQVAVKDALGRILAEDVVSPVNVPPHDNSAVDGYAFLASGLPADGRLRLAGRIAAGHPFTGTLAAGECLRILTGAPMAAGTDCVAMQEDCRVEGDVVWVPTTLQPGANRRSAGEDVARGRVVLAAGRRLRPQDLGLAAATGRTELTTYRRLRAAVFSTGDEIREPGTELPAGCIYDTNRTTAAALLRALGAEVTDLGILPDKREVIAAALGKAAAEHDLILTSGGVSVGDEDHVRPAVESQGSLHFWKLAIKPGKPVALGEIRRGGEIGGTPFVGLPGNPVAVMITFMLIARPLVLRLAGVKDLAVPRFTVEAGFAFKHKPGRREWLRARVGGQDGRLVAELYPAQGSGVLSSMVWSDGLVEIPEDRGDLAPGDAVAYIPYAEVLR